MSKLPKKFPEYLIMYKIITKKILELNDKKMKSKRSELEEIQEKLKKYELEKMKITSMFPEKFLKDYLEK